MREPEKNRGFGTQPLPWEGSTTFEPVSMAAADITEHGDGLPDLADLIDEVEDRKVCCPFHNDHSPSCHIYHDHYHCSSAELTAIGPIG